MRQQIAHGLVLNRANRMNRVVCVVWAKWAGVESTDAHSAHQTPNAVDADRGFVLMWKCICECWKWSEIYDFMMARLCVRGTRHQGNIRDVTLPGFGLGGAQCTMMALAALIFSSQVMQPDTWTGDIVDQVLMYGDHLYSHLIDTQFRGNHSTYIGHYQIPTSVSLFGSAYHVAIQNTFFGFVGGSKHSEIGTLSVTDALHMSLTLSSMVLVTIGAESFSFFSDATGIYLFDSHARNSQGLVDGTGTAVVLHFSDETHLVIFLTDVYGNMEFELCPIQICSNNDTHSNLSSEPIPDGHNSHVMNPYSSSKSSSYSGGIQSCTNQNRYAVHSALHNHSYSDIGDAHLMEPSERIPVTTDIALQNHSCITDCNLLRSEQCKRDLMLKTLHNHSYSDIGDSHDICYVSGDQQSGMKLQQIQTAVHEASVLGTQTGEICVMALIFLS